MRTSFWLAILATVTVLAVPVGCDSRDGSVKIASDLIRVRVSGSGTCLPLLRILTDSYDASGVNFVYLPGLHSGGGIKGVAQGDLEIGAVSRELNEKEDTLGLEYHGLSRDGLALAVHPSVTLEGLTSDQVRAIYRGEHASWKEFGGPDLPVVVLDRNEDESAKIILRRYVLGDTLKVAPKAVNLYYESDMVEGLLSQPGAIGYFSLGYALSQNVRARFLKLDGVEPTVSNIESGVYGVVRPLGMVVDPTTDPETYKKVSAFVKWATGPEAARLMRARGFTPILRQE